MSDLKQKVAAHVDSTTDTIINLSDTIHANPELGFAEHEASALLAAALEGAGFTVAKGTAGLETAFVAEYRGGEGGPTVALLCEYDALPEIGHACGHNLIGAASVGAALGLRPVLDGLSGRLLVIGAPGEETGGGKVLLTQAGVFEGVDAAMLVHPGKDNRVLSTSNAIDALEFEFTGKAAHAASSPEKGINALDAAILMFNGVNALRQHVNDGVRIHGVIVEGGLAPNIVPARAVARFYVRAAQRKYLDEVVAKVVRCAQAGAMATGAQVAWRNFEYSNDNMVPNKALGDLFENNLRLLGISDIKPPEQTKGSTDMGNVSHACPAIHPSISIGENLIGHTPEFAAACVSPAAHQALVVSAKALAFTAVDLFLDKEAVRRVAAEFAGK